MIFGMNRIIKTVILAVIGLAAIAWACTYKFSGLAWFPGFFVGLCAFLRILSVNQPNKAN